MRSRRADVPERRESGWYRPHAAADWHYLPEGGDLTLCGAWPRPGKTERVAYGRKPVAGILRMEPNLAQVCAACLDARRAEGESW